MRFALVHLLLLLAVLALQVQGRMAEDVAGKAPSPTDEGAPFWHGGKSVYQKPAPDHVSPAALERLSEIQRAVGLLRDPQTRTARGSAVLVAPRLLLTAAHVVQDPAAPLELVFDHERDGKGVVRPGTAVGAVEVWRAPSLDVALLHLLTPPPAGIRPVTLDATPLTEEASVELVHHPAGGPRVISRSGRVIFPDTLPRARMPGLLHRATANVAPEDRAAMREEIRASYATPGEDRPHRLHVRTWNGHPQPSLGVAVDAFHGSSGGALLDGHSTRLVALLVDGQPDRRFAWTPGWARHEIGLPVADILRALRGAPSDIQAHVAALRVHR